MNSKFVVLLLAGLQVSYSSQLELPHTSCYSRQPDSCGDNPPGSNYDAHHQSLNNDDHCPYQSDDAKPVLEGQQEDVCRSDSLCGDEGNHIDGESAEDEDGAGNVFLQGRPRQGDCDIVVNGKQPIEDLSAPAGIGTEPCSEGISGEAFQTNYVCHSGEAINSQSGASVPGGTTNRDIQESIANSAYNQQIRAAALRATTSPENTLIPEMGPIEVTPSLPFLPCGVPINQPIRPTFPLPLGAPALPWPVLPSPKFCIKHRLVPVPIRVVEDCITNVPVIRKTVRHQVETITRHVPVLVKTVTQQHEHIVRHVPVAGKTLRSVVETRVRHIPVIKSRSRTVVEPYTVHFPVTIRFTRPVEESITKIVPVQEVRVRPVLTERTRLVPIVERRIRPIVEQRIHKIPVKRKYLRTVVEQRVRPVVVSCQPCCSSTTLRTSHVPHPS